MTKNFKIEERGGVREKIEFKKRNPAGALLEKDLNYVLSECGEVWKEYQGAELLITGGTGFIGRWLLETFLKANRELKLGARLTVLSRHPELFLEKAPHLKEAGIVWVKGDVRNFSISGVNPTHIVHGATTSSDPVDDGEMIETIVEGTRRVLDFATKNKTKKFLFLSSGAVYGSIPPEISKVPESFSQGQPLQGALSVYAQGKIEAEALCLDYAQKHLIDLKIARCFAFVGAHLPLDAHYAIGNFIANAMRGEPIRIKSNGLSRRSYLYAADLVIWLWTLLAKGSSCPVVNIGSEESLTIKELAQIVVEEIHPELEIILENDPLSLPSRHYVPDCQTARREYLLNSKIDLRESIRRTVEWLRQ